jgi:hypothetical protein
MEVNDTTCRCKDDLRRTKTQPQHNKNRTRELEPVLVSPEKVGIVGRSWIGKEGVAELGPRVC